MPTEAQIIEYIYTNWPSLTIGTGAGVIYIALYSRLKTFLDRQAKQDELLVKQAREICFLKRKVSKIVMTHCARHVEDMPRLMKDDEEDDEPQS